MSGSAPTTTLVVAGELADPVAEPLLELLVEPLGEVLCELLHATVSAVREMAATTERASWLVRVRPMTLRS
jgi:hypothetical protein